jgi:hypothetical protein
MLYHVCSVWDVDIIDFRQGISYSNCETNLRGSPLPPASVLPVGEPSRFNTTWTATSDLEDSNKLCRYSSGLNHADERVDCL